MTGKFYLTCPGAQLTEKEREYLKSAAEYASKNFTDPTFVNLGVMWGASMHCLRAGSKDAFLVGVDIDFNTPKVKEPELLGENCRLDNYDSALHGMQWHSPVHIVFVDADHRYEAVKADIEAWSRHVVSGGLMIFHDYAPTQQNLDAFPHIAGVRKAVNEWYEVEGIFDNDWKKSDTGLPVPPDSLFVARKL